MPAWFEEYLKSLDETQKKELYDYIDGTGTEAICDLLEAPDANPPSSEPSTPTS